MKWSPQRSSRMVRHRARPTLELLEGRRLLASANAAVAMTPDVNGNLVLVNVQPSGAVTVNMKRPTNDASNPYQYSGNQTLTGLSAASVTATTLSNGDPVVYAKTGLLSYLYANEYVATNDPANPFAWTGWQQVGNFVSTSATAVTSGTTSAVFAIGADSQVYAATVVPATTTGTAATLGTFQKLPDFGAGSIVVQGDGPGRFEVAALAGPMTYIYDIRVTLGDATPVSTGWQQVGDFVATSLDLTPGVNTTPFGTSLGDRLFLFAVGADTNAYYNPLPVNAVTGNRDSTTFEAVGISGVASARGSVGSGYFTLYAVTTSGLILNRQYVATGLTDSPIVPNDAYGIRALNYDNYSITPAFTATALVVGSRPDGGFELLASASDGTFRANRQYPHSALRFSSYLGYLPNDNTFGGFVDVTTSAVHPIAVSGGNDVGRVIASLGSNGTVYVSTAPPTSTDAPNPVFTAFAALPGITATSIAAAQLDAEGEMALYALTGSSSLVYENQYLATGDGSTSFAWTGWRPLGIFEAKAIAAAYTAGADQASVFAIATSGLVAAVDRSANAENPVAAFVPLPGLTAASLAVRGYDDSTVELVAIPKATGYAYTRFYHPSGAGTPTTTSPPTDQWFFTGDYVVSKVAGGRNGKYVVGVSPYGYAAASSSYEATDATRKTNVVALNVNTAGAYNVSANGYRTVGLVSINGVSADASIQLIVPIETTLASPTAPANVFIVSGGGTIASGAVTAPAIPDGSLFRSLGASTAAIESEYYVGDTLGRIYVAQFSNGGAPVATFSAYALVGTVPG